MNPSPAFQIVGEHIKDCERRVASFESTSEVGLAQLEILDRFPVTWYSRQSRMVRMYAIFGPCAQYNFGECRPIRSISCEFEPKRYTGHVNAKRSASARRSSPCAQLNRFPHLEHRFVAAGVRRLPNRRRRHDHRVHGLPQRPIDTATSRRSIHSS